MTDSMPMSPAPPAPPPAGAGLQEWTAYQLALQAEACRLLGSLLYAGLLGAAASDVRRSGPAWAVLRPHAGRGIDDALALRFMAAVHRLVLSRKAPELALFFPSVGGTADPEAAWPAMRAVLEEHREVLTAAAARPCQTNEVGRCAALVGGFLTAAGTDGLPLRLLEIGTSGGLNLRWDRYHYADASPGRSWGDPASPVRLRGVWDVPESLCHVTTEIVQRGGCDPAPVDPTTDEGRLSLTASIWGDQPARFERLRGALQVAAALPVDVAEARAIDWLPGRLADTAPGAATVVFHSVVLQYLEPEEREAVVHAIADAGAQARENAPLYWLRMEPTGPLRDMTVRMTRWPGGEDRFLATAGAHGDPVHWGGGAGKN